MRTRKEIKKELKEKYYVSLDRSLHQRDIIIELLFDIREEITKK